MFRNSYTNRGVDSFYFSMIHDYVFIVFSERITFLICSKPHGMFFDHNEAAISAHVFYRKSRLFVPLNVIGIFAIKIT